jgi:hypothetical protein
MTVNDKTSITFVVLGLVVLAVSLPLYLGRIRMNGLYGFKIRKAFKSEGNWYAINKYGAKVLIIWSAALMALGIICLYIQPEHVLTVAKVGFISIIVPIVQAMWFARKLPQEEDLE